MVHYLIMIHKILHLLIIQLFLVSFFNAQVIATYIVCYQPIKAIQNIFLCSNSITVKVKPS